MIQIAGGIEHMAKNGFLINGNFGYTILLKEANCQITNGLPTRFDLTVLVL